jgi:hypothetical protein
MGHKAYDRAVAYFMDPRDMSTAESVKQLRNLQRGWRNIIMGKFDEAARANVDRHLGDCYEIEDEPSPDAIYSEAYTLAFDGAKDAGASMEEACVIATRIAQCYAQP